MNNFEHFAVIYINVCVVLLPIITMAAVFGPSVIKKYKHYRLMKLWKKRHYK